MIEACDVDFSTAVSHRYRNDRSINFSELSAFDLKGSKNNKKIDIDVFNLVK
jgi:hypothetical protein